MGTERAGLPPLNRSRAASAEGSCSSSHATYRATAFLKNRLQTLALFFSQVAIIFFMNDGVGKGDTVRALKISFTPARDCALHNGRQNIFQVLMPRDEAQFKARTELQLGEELLRE